MIIDEMDFLRVCFACWHCCCHALIYLREAAIIIYGIFWRNWAVWMSTDYELTLYKLMRAVFYFVTQF